ncbi:MAG: AEC family transporter, partial [Erysipelotrichaceae bacterium]
ITDIILYIILPANIIVSFNMEMNTEILKQSATILIIAFSIQIVYLILNRFMYLGFDHSKAIIMKYGTICTNATFMGLPIIQSVFGASGLLYATVALIPMRVFMWTSGLSLFTKTSKKKALLTMITHPAILAVVLGFILMSFQLKLPIFINSTLIALSNCMTALSMILIGSILGQVNFKHLVDKSILYYTFLRLIMLPAFIYLILYLLKVNPIIIGVTVLMAAMPAGLTTAMLAQKYNQDALYASKLIFISTLLSLFTLPLLIYALG